MSQVRQFLNSSRARLMAILRPRDPRATRTRIVVLLTYMVGLASGIGIADYNFGWRPTLPNANTLLISWGSQNHSDSNVDLNSGANTINDQVSDATTVGDDSNADLIDENEVADDSATSSDGAEQAGGAGEPAAEQTAQVDDESNQDEVIEVTQDDIPDSLRQNFRTDPMEAAALNWVGLQGLFPEVVETETEIAFDRESILNDHDERVTGDFKIPQSLKNRVGFWFDVYSTYDANHRIIHHSLYPWIVYKVVDVSYIINSETPRHLWMRRQNAERAVKKEVLKICQMLSDLIHRRSLNHLNEEEQALVNLFKPLGGDLRHQLKTALHSVRIQTGQRNFFLEGIQISSSYLGEMEDIFRSYKLPVELTRIPFVESSFNRRATSKVGALGIWQFMGNTGRKYMLVNGSIDERSSPFKATEAAARLLKENHLILHHSWPLAVTAWNHGPTGLRKAMSRAGSLDLATIIRRYRSRSFDFASANFYSEFLGALFAERYSDEIFGKIERAPQQNLLMVRLSRSVHFNDLLRVSGLSKEDLLASNPELARAARANLLLPRGFRLHVPGFIIQNLGGLLADNPAQHAPSKDHT